MSEFEIVVAHLAIAGLPATAGKPHRGSRIAIDHVFSTGYECSSRLASEAATADEHRGLEYCLRADSVPRVSNAHAGFDDARIGCSRIDRRGSRLSKTLVARTGIPDLLTRPDRGWALFLSVGAAEPVPGCPMGGIVSMSICRSHVLGPEMPRAATKHSTTTRGRALGTAFARDRKIARCIPILNPLPDVPREILRAEWTLPRRTPTHLGGCVTVTLQDDGSFTGRRLVPPGIKPSIIAASGTFPLRFCWKSLAAPAAKNRCVVPVHTDDGLAWRAEQLGKEFHRRTANPGFDTSSVVPVGHFVAIDVEPRDLDLVCRGFVILGDVADRAPAQQTCFDFVHGR